MTRMRAMYDGAAGYVTGYEHDLDDEPTSTWVPPGASEPEPTTIDPDDRGMRARVKAAVDAFVVLGPSVTGRHDVLVTLEDLRPASEHPSVESSLRKALEKAQAFARAVDGPIAFVDDLCMYEHPDEGECFESGVVWVDGELRCREHGPVAEDDETLALFLPSEDEP
jgi:hypothetical protein